MFHGDFLLASGGRSSFYIDCKLTTLDPVGATLAGEVMFDLICGVAKERGLKLDAVGGLTMGADPLALAIGMRSVLSAAGSRSRSSPFANPPRLMASSSSSKATSRQETTWPCWTTW